MTACVYKVNVLIHGEEELFYYTQIADSPYDAASNIKSYYFRNERPIYQVKAENGEEIMNPVFVTGDNSVVFMVSLIA